MKNDSGIKMTIKVIKTSLKDFLFSIINPIIALIDEPFV